MIALDGLLARLAANAEAIAALARAVSADQARRAPSAEEWSILDVIGHLEDEEREDFRTRVRLTLEDPEADWPPEVLIASVAHDHLHLRQLNRLHWQWLSRSATPRSLDYAGGW